MTCYTGIVHKDETSDYGVHFPDMPGCFTAGSTMEEALDNAMQALAFHVDELAKDGDEIPAPRTIEELHKDEDFVEDIKTGGAIIYVPLLSSTTVKRRVEIQMEANLLAAIDRHSKATGITRTAFIHEATKKLLMTG